MDCITDIAQYKDLLSQLRGKPVKYSSNNFCMPSYFQNYAADGRLFYKIVPSGILIFTDEKKYYNLYYTLDLSQSFPPVKTTRPVLIEEISANENRSAYIRTAEKRFKAAGFRLFKVNHMYSLNISKQENNVSLLQGTLPEGFYITNADTPELAEKAVSLWEDALDVTDIPEDHKHFLSSEADRVFCLMNGKKPVGTIFCRMGKNSCEERHVVVHPEFKRRGFGKFLLSFAAGEAKKAGKSTMTTWISDSNAASISMHQKTGFVLLPRSSTQYILKGEENG